MEVEWDDNKAATNLEKHGISFEDAKNVFLDPSYIQREDTRDYGEVRFQVIGAVKQRILFVVYTRRTTRFRLISARKASRNERKQYYQSQT